MSISHIRVAHVIRFTSHSDPTFWVDVLRIDAAFFNYIDLAMGSGATQGIDEVLLWGDGYSGGFGDDGNGPPTDRTMSPITVSNPGNPAQSVGLEIIQKMKLVNMGQGTFHYYNNTVTNLKRTVDVVDVYPTDVSSLDMSQPVSWDVYLHVLEAGAQDTSQSLQVEFPKTFKALFQGDPSGAEGLGRIFYSANKPVFEVVTQGNQGPF
jgi:hypothetical protein